MKLLTSLVFLFISSFTFGQKYFVFDIKGKVSIDGVPLAVKTMLTPDIELTFGSDQAEVHVVSIKGKQLINTERLQPNAENNFIGKVQAAILPPEKYRTSITRANGTELKFSNLSELKAFFRYEVLVFDTTHYELTTPDFYTDSTHYFEMRYTANDTLASQILPGTEQDFYITNTAQLDSSGHDVELIYLDQTKKQDTSVGNFKLVTADQAKIVETFQLLHEIFPKPGAKFLFEEALPYLEMRYGKANPAQVKALLERALGLEF